MPETKQVRKIVVDFKVSGDGKLKQAGKNIGNINKKVNNLSAGLGRLKAAFLGMVGAIGIRELAKTSDTFQLLQDRISVFSGSAEKASSVMNDIAVVARHTRSSIDTIAEGFNRVAVATAGTGLSMDQMLGVTQTLQQTLRLSGAGAQEATSTFLQFTQALSLGRLQGQELRAVMLSNAKLAGILADSLGRTKGELKLLGEQGKLTNEKVLKALSDNFQQLEKDASKLGTTFEQSTIILIDTLRLKFFRLSQELGLAKAFENFTTSLLDNLDLVGAGIVGLATLWVFNMGLMVVSLETLKASLITTGIGAAIVVVGSAIGYLALNWEQSLLYMKIAWNKYLVLPIQKFLASEGVGKLVTVIGNVQLAWEQSLIYIKLAWAEYVVKPINEFLESSDFESVMDTLKLTWKLYLALMKLAWEDYIEKPIKDFFGSDKVQGAVKGLSDAWEATTKTIGSYWEKYIVEPYKDIVSDLNDNPIVPTMDKNDLKIISETTKEISKLEKELKKIQEKKDVGNVLDRIPNAMNNLKVSAGGGRGNPLSILNLQFEQNTITLNEYQKAIEKIKLDELNKKFVDGKISVIEYNKELTKIPLAFEKMSMGEQVLAGLETGIQSLRTQFGTLAGDIAKGVGNTFSTLEDQLVDFVRKGKLSFKDLANSILDDMARIAIRQAIIRPLAGSLGGLFDTSGASGANQIAAADISGNAMGNAFHGGKILPFARGGVVSSPTLFPMANGAGLMGEAGPEAILPLSRGANGKLGVQSLGGGTVVNVINNSNGTEIETQENVGPNGESRIDVLIVDKVKTAIGDGRMDRTFKEVYGINRRGR